jgi:hypothetical protein
LRTTIGSDPGVDAYANPILTMRNESEFHDSDTFFKKFSKSKHPIFININKQSLNSKYEKLRGWVSDASRAGVPIEVIAIQETWRIKFPNHLEIPGFQKLIYKNRASGQGGGVGFYIKKGLNYKLINMPFNDFRDKIFESMTLEVSNNNNGDVRKFYISTVYRSPTLLRGMTTTDQYGEFMGCFESLLNYLSAKNVNAYIFTDSNIDLLKYNNCNVANGYLNLIIESGFTPVNLKATHHQGGRHSLIDHVLCNGGVDGANCGSIIKDISDHWITYIQPKLTKHKCGLQRVTRRSFNAENMNNFKRDLTNFSWDDVLIDNDVDSSYSTFWSKFKLLYDLRFPLVTVRFNKNFHKVSNFMTNGLIISHRTKISLLKLSLNNPTEANANNYKVYRNLYNKVVRACKKLHKEGQINQNKKNPKKCGKF